MLHGTNSNPKQWVSNQDGSIRFDAKPLIDFLEADSTAILTGSMAADMEEAFDNFALNIVHCPEGDMGITRQQAYKVMEAMRLIRNIVRTAHYEEPKK